MTSSLSQRLTAESYKTKLAVVIFSLFFLTLFLKNRNTILFTPDFGESDAYHLSLSLKHYLAQNLKQNTLPFWTNQIQGGFPLFAEGQIGALFLPNILFLRFLPFSLGYNLLFVFSLFCLTLGFYLFLKSLKVNPLIAFLTSFVFTFNGSLSLRWIHLNLIQSMSLLPFLFYFSQKFLLTKRKKYLVLFPVFLSQMIFAGHLQIIFIGLLGLGLWYLSQIWFKINKKKEKIYFLIIFAIILTAGIIFSLPQLFPTYILSQNSSRMVNLGYESATSFPFNWENLTQFIFPYKFGDPRNGSYPPYTADWGIFWENTPYLGIAFFTLFIFVIPFFLRKSNDRKAFFIYFCFVLFFILLALGKYSPLYFVFNFSPFSFFRAPPKYLIMTNLFLIVIFAIMLDQVFNKWSNMHIKLIIIFACLFIIFDLLYFAFKYHLFIENKKILKTPQIIQFLDKSLFLTVGQNDEWNKVFNKKGWKNDKTIQSYLFFKNFLYPESNLLFDKSTYNINTGGFKLKRPEYMEQLLESLINDDSDKKRNLQILKNLSEILGIKYFLTTKKLNTDDFLLIKSFTNKKIYIYLYQLKKPQTSFYYIPKKVKKIEYLNDLLTIINNNELSISSGVIENAKVGQIVNPKEVMVDRVKSDKNHYMLNGYFPKQTLIIFRQNYYPEWEVLIDKKNSNLEKVNFTQIGVMAPKGKHSIELKYSPIYFRAGLLISVVFFLSYLLAVKYLVPINRSL